MACDPRPQEVWVHVDQSDSGAEAILAREFPSVHVIISSTRQGPGGGRNACLRHCTVPFAVSFDDDSWPVDNDFFARTVELFAKHLDASVIGATIWHRHQAEIQRTRSFRRTVSFTGCGCAIRISAYLSIRGYVPRPIAYGLEETDLSLQLFAAGRHIYESGDLRVFHDTELSHHNSPEITECVVANAALLAFLRYPIAMWSIGFLQVLSNVAYCLRAGRWRGVLAGLRRIPADCVELRCYRDVLSTGAVIGYLCSRRSGRNVNRRQPT
jgi:GT2 family glycosyltransferase